MQPLAEGEKMKFKVIFIMTGLIVTILEGGCGNSMLDQARENQKSDMGNTISADVSESSQEEEGQEQSEENGTQKEQEYTGLDEMLAQYRQERQESNEKMSDGTILVVEPSQDTYDIDLSGYEYMNSLFDTREKTEAFAAAIEYLKTTYGIEKVNSCVDPRIYEIYGNEDKGVADGYEDSNIFVAEYENSDGEWNYLILVREGKGAEWKVIGDGKDYRE